MNARVCVCVFEFVCAFMWLYVCLDVCIIVCTTMVNLIDHLRFTKCFLKYISDKH